MIDEKFTKEIQEWLATPDSQKDIPAGATLLLRMNRNRIFYTNVLARPQKFLPKLKYELQKHLAYRLDRKTLDEVVKMNREVIPAAAETLKTVPADPVIDAEQDLPQDGTIVKGKRSDHEQLPPDIQQLWTDCADLYFRIKQLFETLKTMDKAEPCDRYEYLKQLDELDKKYRQNMDVYDHYVIGQNPDGQPEKTPASSDEDPKVLINKINASRKYLSENKIKLAELKDLDPEKYTKLLAKVQERYDFLMAQGQNLEAEQTAALLALGVVTETSSGD